MRSYFEGKTIVISGIARGIGKALALQAGEWGMQVAGFDLRKEDLVLLEIELKKNSVAFHLEEVDIRDENSCKKFVENTVQKLGGIDMLINNAGITHIAPENETSVAAMKRLIDINFNGMAQLSHYALPEIIKNQGTLAGVSSVAGYSPLLYRTAYAASKHAVWGYLASLRAEMRDKNVQVLTICPSFVATDLQESQQKYFKNTTNEALTPAYVANEIIEAIQERKDLILIGSTAKKVYWLNRFFPGIYEWIMIRKSRI